MIETGEILQTMAMIQEQNFDIRTITLGINLLDCSHPSPEACAQRVYDKICRVAKDLVRTGEAIERELGIPIVNKRISVTPVSLICQGDPRPIAKALDRAAKEMGVNFLGGYSALMHKGATLADERLLVSIPEVLSTTERLCSSVNVGSTRAGINMNAVREMGEIIKKTAALTADTDGLGCAKLVVFCNAVEDNPFMAGAFCGVGEPECAINVGGAFLFGLWRVGQSRLFMDEFGEVVKALLVFDLFVGYLDDIVAHARECGGALGIGETCGFAIVGGTALAFQDDAHAVGGALDEDVGVAAGFVVQRARGFTEWDAHVVCDMDA